MTVYVKLRTVDGPLPVADAGEYGLGYFLLEVEEVLEDAAAEWEGGMRITSGVRYAPAPTLDEPWARATSPRSRNLAPAPDYFAGALGGVSLGGSAGRGGRRGASPRASRS